MTNTLTRHLALVLGCTLALLTGCGDDETGPSSEAIEPLDPTQSHYGRDYAAWAGLWAQWSYEVSAPTCDAFPGDDPTGANCATGQPDPSVFFLAGNHGGTTKRSQCSIPEGRAIFFPIVLGYADNGGVSSPLSDEALLTESHNQLGRMKASSLVVEIDGQELDGLERFAVDAAPYTYTLPPEPNNYSCLGQPGVSGSYPGYTSGYFIMLPPLSSGAHSIRFAASVDTGVSTFALDVTYDPLTIE